MARDLAQVKAQSEHQAATIALLLDKINLLAGLVGTPDPSLTTPTLWQATHTTYNWLLELQSKMQEPSNNNQSDIKGLVEALELDHKAGLQCIAFLEAKQVETTQSLKKTITLGQIKEFLPRVVQEELISKLHKIKPLLLCTQRFLDHTLPSLSPSATIRINKLGLSSMGDSMQEDILLQEFRELASTIQATQAEHSALLRDLQARAEDSVIDIKGKRFPSLSFVTAYVNTKNIAHHSLKMVDTMSLLEMVTSMSQNVADNINSQFRGRQVNMEQPSNQKALYSFQLSAPTALAGRPDTACANPRSLLAFKNYEALKGTGSGDSGAVNELLHLLDDKTPAFATEIRTSDMMPVGQI